MPHTISVLAQELASGATTARALTEACLERIADPAGEGARTFLAVHAEQARATADHYDRRRHDGHAVPAFAGIPLSIKDLFDEAGAVTSAGSRVLRDRAPAAKHSTAVARLRAAGFNLIGRTNMTEFAYSGIGVNPHYGTPLCPWDRATKRVPGGSSSGAAVSVTDGMAVAALGSDTGGSCRVPAAFCGLAGFKPTLSSIPRDGTIPLSSTLDTVGVLASSVGCCASLFQILADRSLTGRTPVGMQGLSLGIPKTLVLDGFEPHVATSFDNAAASLSRAGATIEQFDFPLLGELAALSAKGGIIAAEAYAWHCRQNLLSRADEYDPRVIFRIRRGGEQSAADYIDVLEARADLIARDRLAAGHFDALIFPTTPIVAPALSAVEDDGDFHRLNLLALRNPTVVNLLDRCAISIPCHSPGTAPVGLMIVGRANEDERLLAIAAAIEEVLLDREM